MPRHYLQTNLFKGLGESVPAEGGGGGSKTLTGPRGGQIKKISPTTGKPVYYKKWAPGQGYDAHSLGSSDKGGYEAYKNGSVIGKTSGGLPVHSDTGVNDKYKERTHNYEWRDHVDAHQAHFSLAQSIKNLIMDRLLSGGDTSKLHGRYNAHMDFSGHHYKEALLNLIHGKDESASQENLGKREE